MRLKRARVTNFKSVLDSEWFTLDQLTCLVGKNESGKTTVLEALEKLGSVRTDRQDLRDTEYPRMNWSEYEESTTVDVAVSAEWELSSVERDALAAILGSDDLIYKDGVVSVTKNYNNQLEWTSPFSLAAVVKHAIDTSGLNAAEKAKLVDASTSTELLDRLKAMEEPSQREVALLTDLEERWPHGGAQLTANKYFASRMPKFVYYSQYDRLPGRVALDQLSTLQAQDRLEELPGARVFLSLLSMVGTTAESISAISTSEELISKLEAVQNRLSKKIFKYWSQNKHLKVRFRFDEASPGDQPPYNSGKIFQTRIENTRHEATIRLDERSTGFIWFFSFLVWFSEVTKEFGDNLVVLLDEPGLTLHARAQADLLRYIDEELLTKYQVVYTTHSPFMIDSSKLMSCRTVEDASGADGEVLGTKVGDRILSTDDDTLFPLQAALGYDVTQSLFIGEHSLLVEGPSDLLYIQWASDALRSAKRTALDPRWTVTPCGGISKVPSFLSLFGGNGLHIAVLTDYGRGDKNKVREIRESHLLRDGHVFTADGYAELENASEADIEDILGRGLYIKILKAAYGLKASQLLPRAKPSDASERITEESRQHFMTLPPEIEMYDHFAPSRYLVEHSSEFSGPEVEAALDRFEKFFKAVNALL